MGLNCAGTRIGTQPGGTARHWIKCDGIEFAGKRQSNQT